MELKRQVCSLELAKQLKELGVEQKVQRGNHYWSKDGRLVLDVTVGDQWVPTDCYRAFTVAELGEMLPQDLQLNGLCDWWSQKADDIWICKYRYYASSDQTASTEADARAKMLIYLVENKLVSDPTTQRKGV